MIEIEKIECPLCSKRKLIRKISSKTVYTHGSKSKGYQVPIKVLYSCTNIRKDKTGKIVWECGFNRLFRLNRRRDYLGGVK